MQLWVETRDYSKYSEAHFLGAIAQFRLIDDDFGRSQAMDVLDDSNEEELREFYEIGEAQLSLKSIDGSSAVIMERNQLVDQLKRSSALINVANDVLTRFDETRFSAVTAEHVVIAGFYCANLSGYAVKEERQATQRVRDLTYAMLQSECVTTPFCAVRGKIDGEIFEAVSPTILRGFEDFETVSPHGIRAAEYYAGKFYVISPSNWFSKSLVSRTGIIREFVSHPFYPISDGILKVISSRKYEGYMLWNGFEEIRCKNVPTIERLIGSTVWEVDATGHQLRPRPGKTPGSMNVVLACVSAEHAKVWLGRQSLPVVHRTQGAKAIIWRGCGDSMEYLVVKERPDKEYDLPGGHSLVHETNMECIVREGKEELHVDHKFQFVTLSCDASFGTAVFCAPSEAYHGVDVKWLPWDSVPASPPWINRIFHHITQRLGGIRNVPLLYKIKTQSKYPARVYGNEDMFSKHLTSEYVDEVMGKIGTFYCPSPYGVVISRAHAHGFFLSHLLLDSYKGDYCFGGGFLHGCYPVKDNIMGNRVTQFIANTALFNADIAMFLIQRNYPSTAGSAPYATMVQIEQMGLTEFSGHYTYQEAQIKASRLLGMLVRKEDIRDYVGRNRGCVLTHSGFVVK